MRQRRALVESVLLHALLVGGGLALSANLKAPPLVRLDFCLNTLPGAVEHELLASGPTQPSAPPPETSSASSPVVAAPPAKQASRPIAPSSVRPAAQAVGVKQMPSPAEKPTLVPAATAPHAPAASTSLVETMMDDESDTTGAASGAQVAMAGIGQDLPTSVVSTSGLADSGGGATSVVSNEAYVEAYRVAHFGAIRSAILDHLRYPSSARRQGWHGLVEVSFEVDPQGGVRALQVRTSSGYPRLDQVVLDAVQRAAPFPPPPVTAQLVMPVRFELN